MSARVLLLCAEDPRRRLLEDLLAPDRAVVRPLPEQVDGPPWPGPAPDLLVLGAFGRTGLAAELALAALAAEPDLSVLVVDEASHWPEALLARPGLAVVSLGARGGLLAARARLLERRTLLRAAAARRDEPEDAFAAAALVSDVPAARTMALLLQRAAETRAHVVLAGEVGTLRTRLLRQLLRAAGGARLAPPAAGEPVAPAGDDTLFVNDIDALTPLQQGSVLRLLGAGQRIIATATTRFRERAADGRFRSDLYYRLGGQPIVAVPLRERLPDVPRLLHAAGLPAASESVLARLSAWSWPGNLRELELVAEHAALLSRGGPVDERCLPLPGAEDDRFVLHIPERGMALEEIEREALRQTMEASDRNVAEAARRLSVERGKLRYRLRKFGLGR